MAKVLDFRLEVSDFELHSSYYVPGGALANREV